MTKWSGCFETEWAVVVVRVVVDGYSKRQVWDKKENGHLHMSIKFSLFPLFHVCALTQFSSLLQYYSCIFVTGFRRESPLDRENCSSCWILFNRWAWWKNINSYCMIQIKFHLTFLVILPAPSNHSGPVELCSIHDSVALFCVLLWILHTLKQIQIRMKEVRKARKKKMFQKFIENGMVVFRKEYQVQFSKRKSNWL